LPEIKNLFTRAFAQGFNSIQTVTSRLKWQIFWNKKKNETHETAEVMPLQLSWKELRKVSRKMTRFGLPFPTQQETGVIYCAELLTNFATIFSPFCQW